MNPLLLAPALALAVLLTATLSGVFGMVGGMILLWILLLLLPVELAIAVQGVLQFVANASRAWFARTWIDWRIIGFAALGIGAALGLFAAVDYTPNLALVSIAIGILPVFCYLPRHWLVLDAGRPAQAVLCGLLGGGLNVGVGVAGPIVDIFFARTAMDRRTVIGTKAALVLLSHVAKILFYAPALGALGRGEVLAILVAMPFSILGSRLGHAVLARMTDRAFRKGTVALITAVGLFFLVQGLTLLS